MAYVYCIISLVLIFVAGNPLADKLFRDKKSTDFIFYISFPIGIAMIASILNIVVGLNIPLKIPSKVLALFFIVMFIFYTYKTWNLKKWKRFAVLSIPLCFIVLVSGIAYFVIGSDYFIGNRFLDSLFYVENPEALIHFPLNTNVDQYANQPWLMLPTVLNPHRLTITTVQAFLTVVLGTYSINLMGTMFIIPTIVTYCACMIIINSKHKWKGIIICLTIALLPCLTDLYLEGYLGAAFSYPFLLLSIYSFDLMIREKKFENVLLSIFFISTTIMSYSDTTFILAGLLVLIIILQCIKGNIGKLDFIHISIMTIVILVLNIFYIKTIFYNELIVRDATSIDLNGAYSYIHGGSFFSHLFFGENTHQIFVLAGIALYFSSFFGLFIRSIKNKEVLSFVLLIFVASPWVFVNHDETNVYLFYRISVMSAPAIGIGVYYFYQFMMDTLEEMQLREGKKLQHGIHIAALILCSTMVLASIQRQSNSIEQGERVYYLSEESKHNFDTLKALSGKNIYYISMEAKDTYWDFYYGRNNNFWLNNSSLNQRFEIGSWFDIDKKQLYEDTKYSYNNYSTIPENAIILYDEKYDINFKNQETKEKVGLHFQLNDNSVVVPGDSSKLFGQFWVYAYSKEDTTITVDIELSKREGNIAANEIANGLTEERYKLDDGNIKVEMPLKKGINYIYLKGNESFYIKSAVVE